MKRTIYSPGLALVFTSILLARTSSAEEELGRIETAESVAAAVRHEEKMDPAGDGWDSEAFSAQAQARLNQLGSLIIGEGVLTGDALGEIAVAERATTHKLIPPAGGVFDASGIAVRRLEAATASAAGAGLLDELKRLAARFSAPRFKFKLFKVSLLPGGSRAQTRVTQERRTLSLSAAARPISSLTPSPPARPQKLWAMHSF